MKPASRPSVTLLAAWALLAGTTGATALELDGLVKNSPFGQATERAIGEAKPGTLEFRGLYVDNGVTYFSVYNSITKQSAWIAEGEVPTNLPVTIKAYDAASETLIVENAGQPVKLPMRTAVISATPAAPAPAPVAAAPVPTVAPAVGGAPQFGGFGNGQQPTPEQIQAFRDEMRKRWGERQQGGNAEGGVPTDRMSRGRGGEATAGAVPTKGERPTKGAR